MKPLTHYVIVRRDLSIGVLLAMVAHAAGESFYKVPQNTPAGELQNAEMPTDPRTRGRMGNAPTDPVAPVQSFDPSQTIAVVLGARNEGRLLKLERALEAANVAHVAIRETDGEHAGQLLAIGVVPGEKDQLSPLVNDFHMLRELQLEVH